MGIYIYTVGGIPTPLKNDGVRQWEYIYMVGGIPTPLKNGVRQWEGLYIPYMKWKIML